MNDGALHDDLHAAIEEDPTKAALLLLKQLDDALAQARGLAQELCVAIDHEGRS